MSIRLRPSRAVDQARNQRRARIRRRWSVIQANGGKVPRRGRQPKDDVPDEEVGILHDELDDLPEAG